MSPIGFAVVFVMVPLNARVVLALQFGGRERDATFQDVSEISKNAETLGATLRIGRGFLVGAQYM